MNTFLTLLSVLCAFALVRSFIRYDPKLDLVKSRNKYILFLWYNKFYASGEFERRKYIKLFEV